MPWRPAVSLETFCGKHWTLSTRTAFRVNFDPANLAMSGFDYMQAARDLAPYVVHTHAKDGRKGVGELPLGTGDVDFPNYVAQWRSLGYDGFYTVEREAGDDRVGDIARAVEFLKTL
jgi:L-ribulose-5-phosphate 3-epimerase